nr:MAG TPA: hypothetical protein [Microviridae sp.]
MRIAIILIIVLLAIDNKLGAKVNLPCAHFLLLYFS